MKSGQQLVSERELLFETLSSIARFMASLLNSSINCPPIFDGINFSLWKCRVKSFIQSIDFDFWDIIMYGPYVPSWRKDDGDVVTKSKSEYTQDDYERLKTNSGVLYILQCAITDEIFNRVCSCETAKDIWEKLTLIYEKKSRKSRFIKKIRCS